MHGFYSRVGIISSTCFHHLFLLSCILRELKLVAVACHIIHYSEITSPFPLTSGTMLRRGWSFLICSLVMQATHFASPFTYKLILFSLTVQYSVQSPKKFRKYNICMCTYISFIIPFASSHFLDFAEWAEYSMPVLFGMASSSGLI